MQIPLSIRDQCGEATPLLLSLSFSPSLSHSHPHPLLFPPLLLYFQSSSSLCLWPLKWDVWIGERSVYMSACVVGGLFFFKSVERDPLTLGVIAPRIYWLSVCYRLALGVRWFWWDCVCVCVHVCLRWFGLAPSAREPCVWVTLLSMFPRGWSSPQLSWT